MDVVVPRELLANKYILRAIQVMSSIVPKEYENEKKRNLCNSQASEYPSWDFGVKTAAVQKIVLSGMPDLFHALVDVFDEVCGRKRFCLWAVPMY